MAESNRRIRLAFVGGEHLHFRGLLQSALEAPTAEVVGFSIEDDELRSHFEHVHPELPAYRSAEELYDKARPQAIVTCADNERAVAVVADAAERGVHVMKEKPMAATLEGADRMATAAARHGVRLMVNWPTNWRGGIHMARRLVDEGEIGRVLDIHNRAGHGGPPQDFATISPIARVGWGWLIERKANGGGAAIDFCSYGAVMSRWFLGQPSSVIAHGGRYAKEFFTVEDNATMILGYPRAQAVIEGTWTQPAVPVRQPTMIYGTDGAIALTGPDEIQLANRGRSGEQVSTETRTVEPDRLPAHYRSGPDYFTYCLLNDLPFEGMVSPQVSRDAQEILEAGLQSMKTGSAVPLPLPAFAG
ncbi:MAG: Gfo/Idh/MocA family oxidoreductase [Candidatus Dormibacteraeota bacterium]|nr:Gfo/Idh/MocA family oxidoreductase [Candidatus Dormibacteraeota bacterium]